MAGMDTHGPLPAPRRRKVTLRADERRTHPRAGNWPPLCVGGIRGAVRDVSRGGVCLSVSTHLQPGDQYPLRLTCALDRSSIELVGEVTWYRDGCAGLQWVSLTAEQDRWLQGRFLAWLEALVGTSRR